MSNSFPPTIMLEVNSRLPIDEALEMAINEAFAVFNYPNFTLECSFISALDYGDVMIIYEVHRKPELNVKNLLYKKWW